MLWNDRIFVTEDDLNRIDSEASKACEDEGATVSGNYGVIRSGLEEAAQELQKIMVAYGGYLSSGDVSPNHISAVLNIGLGNSTRYKAVLGQVVVAEVDAYTWNHIKIWAVHSCLQYLYRNLSNRTIKDRYDSKMRFFKSELDRRLTRSVTGLGVPLVTQPIAAPASLERVCASTDASNTTVLTSGTWSESNVSQAASAGATGGSFDLAITYVCQGSINDSGVVTQDYTKYISALRNGNAESAPSSTVSSFSVDADNALMVDINSLNPPNGTQDPATRIICVIAPLPATGWNVYVGLPGGILKLQNSSPIPITQKTYQLPGDPTYTGLPIGIGQYSDRRLSISPTRQRS